jgi:diadenosine tetraphosphate (Ap4A) HIT family hydrolase
VHAGRFFVFSATANRIDSVMRKRGLAMDSIFTKILAGEADASFVYRDEHVAAFMDIHPMNAGHVLVVPVKPAMSLADLDDEIAAHMMVVAKHVAAAIRKSGLRCEGINLTLADGEAAGQEVMHVHMHVIPRFTGDGFGYKYDARLQLAQRTALNEAAQRIAAQLDKTDIIPAR